jgi:hypothetical protein
MNDFSRPTMSTDSKNSWLRIHEETTRNFTPIYINSLINARQHQSLHGNKTSREQSSKQPHVGTRRPPKKLKKGEKRNSSPFMDSMY